MTFVLVGGRVCLDFLATLTERRQAPAEQLTDPAQLSEWACVAGLLDEGTPVVPSELAEARDLREALYRTIRTALAGERFRAADVALLNRVARAAPVGLSLTWTGAVRRKGDVPQVLAAIARDALELLDSPQFDRVRECDRPDCTRLYIDASRTRNRRWCDMAECGNRAKVAAFRRRQHGWSERAEDGWAGATGSLTHLPVGD